MVENNSNSSSFKHSKFRVEEIQDYDLVILYSNGDLSILVLKGDELFFYKNFNWHSLSTKPESDYIRPSLVSLDFLGKGSFKSSIIYLSTTKSTLIPSELFSSEHAKSSLQFLCKEDIGRIYSSKVDDLDAFCVFTIQDSVFNVFKSRIPALQFESRTSLILKNDIDKSSVGQEYFHLHIHNKFIECVLIKDKKLQFHNFFSYQTAEELTFYILSISQQFNIDRNKITLHLSGNLTKDSTIYNLLYKYFYSVKFPEIIEISEITADQQFSCFPFLQKSK